MTKKYLGPEHLRDGAVIASIRGVAKEIIDGRPRLVLYFHDQELGLILTRQLAEDISKILGRNRMVDDFFANEGAVH